MWQAIYEFSKDLAAVTFIITGILGMVYVPSYLAYKLANALYRKGKIFVHLFDYARHRKEFKYWRKSKKGTKIKPVSKPKTRRDDE